MPNAIPGPAYTWWTWKFGMTFTNWVLRFFGRVECDHCGEWVEGSIPRDSRPDEAPLACSAGVYVGWYEFNEPGEYIVCDQCMWSNEKYLAVYPKPMGLE